MGKKGPGSKELKAIKFEVSALPKVVKDKKSASTAAVAPEFIWENLSVRKKAVHMMKSMKPSDDFLKVEQRQPCVDVGCIPLEKRAASKALLARKRGKRAI